MDKAKTSLCKRSRQFPNMANQRQKLIPISNVSWAVKLKSRQFRLGLAKFACVCFSIQAIMAPAEATACPTCKEALHGMASVGFAIAILFMMAMPFLIATFWAVVIFRLRRAAEIRS